MEGVLSTVEVTLKMFRRITNPAERGITNPAERVTNPAERKHIIFLSLIEEN